MRIKSNIDLLKPHGQAEGVFTVSIDDGYVEYSYDMDIGAHHSIAMVERKIRRALRCRKATGRIRSPVPLERYEDPKTVEIIGKLQANYDRLLAAFRHRHVNNGIPGDDRCKQCGLDLRDEIHVRVVEPSNDPSSATAGPKRHD